MGKLGLKLKMAFSMGELFKLMKIVHIEFQKLVLWYQWGQWELVEFL